MVNPSDPSVGINADSGAMLTGWDHVVQSLRDMFLTRFGTRIMREWYGSFVPDALGRNINRQEILPVLASITSAIEQWEPRFLPSSVAVDFSSVRSGGIIVRIPGQYRPRALLGDLRVEGDRTLIVDMAADGMEVR